MANTSAPFTPTAATSLAVTGTAASVTLPTAGGDTMLIMNDGVATSYWKTGATVATATATAGNPILAGAIMIYTVDPTATVLSGIAATGATTTLRIQYGYGV